MRLHVGWIVAASAAAALSGCAKQIAAPMDRGVCWHVATLDNGAVKFNKVSTRRAHDRDLRGRARGDA